MWTLVELSPAIIDKTLERKALMLGWLPSEVERHRSEAQQRLLRENVRQFYVQVERGEHSWVEYPHSAIIMNQLGQTGSNPERTPAFRYRITNPIQRGVMSFEDIVRPDEATYSIVFHTDVEEGNGCYSGEHGCNAIFTFETTESQILAELGSAVPTAPDRNNDGFGVGDAMSILGGIMDIIGIIGHFV